MKRTFIESFERELLKESVWPELELDETDDELDLENSSSYLIQVESNGKVVKEQEKNGIVDEEALEEILDFIYELTPEEKQNVALVWNLDWEEIGDKGGDVVVSVYGPSERDEWSEEERADVNEWTLSNWIFAEKQIRRALGLPKKQF